MPYWIILLLLSLPSIGYSHQHGRVSQLFHHVMDPMLFFITVLHTVCSLVGGAFVIGAVVRYIQHRHNPGQTPVNQPIVLGLLGLVLCGLPFMTRYALVYPHVLQLPNFLQ